jgi:hypothetical protein
MNREVNNLNGIVVKRKGSEIFLENDLYSSAKFYYNRENSFEDLSSVGSSLQSFVETMNVSMPTVSVGMGRETPGLN